MLECRQRFRMEVGRIFGVLLLTVLVVALRADYVEDFQTYFRSQLIEEQRGPVYVTTKNGTIRGFTARAVNNRTIHTYQRIPFGKPPVGDLRFKAPEPTNGWEGILDGTVLTPACPQLFTAVVPDSEDCLFLNVYSTRTGNETDRPLAPVMVFMYGGAFLLGETSYYSGNRLLSQDVVLVVPNYRVGTLGFLATGDEASPGNYGLKDQNLALRWVQENIAAFGGDPNRVTIFGESAGAASVIFHLISPASQGLFHAVIAQSGTAITPWAVDPDPVESAEKIARITACPTDSSSAIVDCLRERSLLNITAGYFFGVAFTDIQNADFGLRGTNAVVEPDLPGAFLTKDPYELLKTGPIPDVPVVLGAVAEEGGFFLGGFHFLGFGNQSIVNTTLNNPQWMREEMLKEFLTTYKFREESGNVAVEEALALAFTPDDNRLDFDQISTGLRDLFSVMVIKGPVLKTADILSERLSNVYLYSFEFRPQNPRNSLWWYLFELFVPIVGGQTPPLDHGIVHADDLMYLFNFPFILDDRDLVFSEMHTQLWTDFATYGTPTPDNSTYLAWPKYSWRDPKYYVLDETPSVKSDYPLTQWRQ